jgi:hypothetical protein
MLSARVASACEIRPVQVVKTWNLASHHALQSIFLHYSIRTSMIILTPTPFMFCFLLFFLCGVVLLWSRILGVTHTLKKQVVNCTSCNHILSLYAPKCYRDSCSEFPISAVCMSSLVLCVRRLGLVFNSPQAPEGVYFLAPKASNFHAFMLLCVHAYAHHGLSIILMLVERVYHPRGCILTFMSLFSAVLRFLATHSRLWCAEIATQFCASQRVERLALPRAAVSVERSSKVFT